MRRLGVEIRGQGRRKRCDPARSGRSTTQPAGSGCAASTKSTQYDTLGNVLSIDDFNGARTCFEYAGPRNNESARVEGLPLTANCSAVLVPGAVLPAGARRISTTWHPTWQLPLVVASPKRKTTSVYNGQPDPFASSAIANCTAAAPLPTSSSTSVALPVLCKKVEQATLDANGTNGLSAALDTTVSARITSTTFNDQGQPYDAIDERGMVTKYRYSANGNLLTVTNAKSHVTTYANYTGWQKPQQVTDANGVVTTAVYDDRGRLKSTTTSGRTTSFTYWVGALSESTTLPGGTKTTLVYDDALRLIGVKDSLGNSIEYTLDAAGRRLGEKAKDPKGVLRTAVRRTRDALGRVDQLTGNLNALGSAEASISNRSPTASP